MSELLLAVLFLSFCITALVIARQDTEASIRGIDILGTVLQRLVDIFPQRKAKKKKQQEKDE